VRRRADAGAEDVGGLDRQLAELREQVLYPLTHPHLYAHSAVARRPTGMLLYGPPGTGKTLLAKAVARATKAAFLNVNIAQLQSKWYGETPKLVSALFSLARKLAPCILFVDEIDGFLGRRRDAGIGGGGGQSAEATATNVFLSCWEGLTSGGGGGAGSEWVLVIGATNRPEALDAAVLRRMPRRIRVGMPDARARADILRVLVRRERVDAAGLDLALVAARAPGFSGSDLREVVREAAMGPIRELIKREEGGGAGGAVADAEAATPPRALATSDLLLALACVHPSGARDVAWAADGEGAEEGAEAGAEEAGDSGEGPAASTLHGAGVSPRSPRGRPQPGLFALPPAVVAHLRREAGGCAECARALLHLGAHLGMGGDASPTR
jgi:SpoVK/Ycf46/Vps4 family AAA+-type ATPase